MRHIHNLAEDAARTLVSAVQRSRRGMERRQGPGCRGRQNQGEGDGTTKAARYWQSATSATQAARIYWYGASADPVMVNGLAY